MQVHEYAGRLNKRGLTDILIVQLEKITFLVKFVTVAIEERENGLKLWQRVLGDVHEGRL
jgi:hypothetical protein